MTLIEMGIYAFLKTSGVWGIPLLLLSFLSLAVIIERSIIIIALYLRNGRPSPEVYLERLENDEDIRDIREKGFFSRILSDNLNGYDPVSVEAVRQEAEKVWDNAVQRLGVLDYIVTVAPLVGILGTITGIIKSFDALGAFSLNKQELLTGGIAEALYTTVAGLIIAVLTLTASSLLRWMLRRFFRPYERIMTLLEKKAGQAGEPHPLI